MIFITKTPPAAVQLMEAAKIQKVPKSNRNKVGKIKLVTGRGYCQRQMPDLNCFTVESAMKMVASTAHQHGFDCWEKPLENYQPLLGKIKT